MSKTRHALSLAAIFAIAIFGSTTSETAYSQQNAVQIAPIAKYKVVFQLTEPETSKWYAVLGNIRNVQDELGIGNVQFELVVYGAAVGMLKYDAVTANQVTEAVESGVKVVACENTMEAMHLVKDDMNPSIGYVRAGIAEIVRKQGEGWFYVRP